MAAPMWRINRFLCVHSCLKNSRLAMSDCNLPRLTVRKIENEPDMDLSFNYGVEKYGIKGRRFNFQRKQNEELSKLKSRIIINIDRSFGKKLKKKKTNQVDDADLTSEHPDSTENLLPEVNLYFDGKLVPDETISSDALVPGAILQVGDIKYEIVVNPPMVKTLSLPTYIMAGFPVYPKLELEFSLKDCSQFRWYRSANVVCHPVENPLAQDSEGMSQVNKKIKTIFEVVKGWELMEGGFTYLTREDDVGRKLKLVCVPCNESDTGEPCEIESSVVVTQGPGPCIFDDRHEYTKHLTPASGFRAVTYNILANLYADSDFTRTVLHPYCPPHALSIDYRKQLILKEIIGYNADLICLQEVDDTVYDYDIRPTLSAIGFEGTFNLKGRNCAEGLACFHRKSKFQLVESYSFVLGEAVESNPIFGKIYRAVQTNKKLQTRLTERSTALQVVILKSAVFADKILCVANTHLYFHPDADHIRLLQSAICVKYLEQLVASISAKNPNSEVSLVLCGDFNSCPEFGVYAFLTTQFIPEDCADWTSNEEEAVKGLCLSHSLTLESACGTPQFTNFTPGFVGCLDYIFADSGKLRVVQAVPLPSEEVVKRHVGLPSIVAPSDHLAVVCDLAWKNVNSSE